MSRYRVRSGTVKQWQYCITGVLLVQRNYHTSQFYSRHSCETKGSRHYCCRGILVVIPQDFSAPAPTQNTSLQSTCVWTGFPKTQWSISFWIVWTFRTSNGSASLLFWKTFLHFAWVVGDAKCIVVMRVSVCVCLYVCLSVHVHMPTLLHGPGCNLGSGGGCPLVVHLWVDFQLVHGLRCYGNITWTVVTSLPSSLI